MCHDLHFQTDAAPAFGLIAAVDDEFTAIVVEPLLEASGDRGLGEA